MKKYFAELIGTMCLVLFGCGAAVISGASVAGLSGLGLLGISLAFGLSVVAMAYTIGGISGCHINPAITIAMAPTTGTTPIRATTAITPSTITVATRAIASAC